MFSAVVVGVAEVGVYMAYLRKIFEAKAEEAARSKSETKEVVETWVIEKRHKKAAAKCGGKNSGRQIVRQRRGQHP
jgi:hypothetical protein